MHKDRHLVRVLAFEYFTHESSMKSWKKLIQAMHIFMVLSGSVKLDFDQQSEV